MDQCSADADDEIKALHQCGGFIKILPRFLPAMDGDAVGRCSGGHLVTAICVLKVDKMHARHLQYRAPLLQRYRAHIGTRLVRSAAPGNTDLQALDADLFVVERVVILEVTPPLVGKQQGQPRWLVQSTRVFVEIELLSYTFLGPWRHPDRRVAAVFAISVGTDFMVTRRAVNRHQTCCCWVILRAALLRSLNRQRADTQTALGSIN